MKVVFFRGSNMFLVFTVFESFEVGCFNQGLDYHLQYKLTLLFHWYVYLFPDNRVSSLIWMKFVWRIAIPAMDFATTWRCMFQRFLTMYVKLPKTIWDKSIYLVLAMVVNKQHDSIQYPSPNLCLFIPIFFNTQLSWTRTSTRTNFLFQTIMLRVHVRVRECRLSPETFITRW